MRSRAWTFWLDLWGPCPQKSKLDAVHFLPTSMNVGPVLWSRAKPTVLTAKAFHSQWLQVVHVWTGNCGLSPWLDLSIERWAYRLGAGIGQVTPSFFAPEPLVGFVYLNWLGQTGCWEGTQLRGQPKEQKTFLGIRFSFLGYVFFLCQMDFRCRLSLQATQETISGEWEVTLF